MSRRAASAVFAIALLSQAFAESGEVGRIVEKHDLAGAAIAVAAGDEVVFSDAAGCAVFDEDGKTCLRGLKPETKMRVASVSKMATAIAAQAMAAQGVLDLDAKIGNYLGEAFRASPLSDRPVTMRMLLSHTSGFRDPEEYWVAAPGRFDSLYHDDALLSAAPQGDFSYANVNYGFAAAVMERVAGERFDRLMKKRVFEPLRLEVGFNWSGVSAAQRSAGAVLYRREAGRWTPQADGRDILESTAPVILAEDGLDKKAYLLRYSSGDNPTLFSPQGGLRASVVDLVGLLQPLRDEAALSTPVWRYDPASPNGDANNGAMTIFGLGVQTVEGNGRFATGLTFVGHSGEAYGLYSGAWLIRAADHERLDEDVRIAFAVNGTSGPPARGAHPSFYEFELDLMRLALEKAGLADVE